MIGRARAFAFVSIAATTMQCADGTAPRPLENSIGVILSGLNPRPAATAAVGMSLGVVATGVAYVSLPPGAVPAGITAMITNRATGVVVGTPIVQGGFDPVSIGANVGDTLAVDISSSRGAVHALLLVAARRHPRVVRTNPPSGGRDVPLNATIVVVFSEPIDPTTLSQGIALRRLDTTDVPGSLGFADTVQLRAAFQPTTPLTPLTTYELQITPAIRDDNGLELDSAVVVSFTTGTLTPPPPPPPVIGRIAFISDGDGTQDLYVMNGDGSNVIRLNTNVPSPRMPAWSPDAGKIAFVSSDSPVPGGYPNGPIYIINADGSGLRKLPVVGADPTWSNDGTKILFAQGGQPASLYEVQADGSQQPVLDGTDFGNALTWSADQSTVAFDWWWETSSYRPANRWCGSCDGYSGVYLRVAGTTTMRRLTDSTADLSSSAARGWFMYSLGAAAWSPDGRRIAFWSQILGIAVAQSDGSDAPTTLIPDTGNSSWWRATERVTWSPDGNYVAAVVDDVPAYQAPGYPQIWLVDATGGAPHVIANRAWDPAWSR